MKYKGQRIFFGFLAMLTLVGGYLLPMPFQAREADALQSRKPKFIFIFLADGAGITHLEITRMFSQLVYNEGLNITDKIFTEGSFGLMTTHSADRLITDSAASATALAIGCKAKNGWVGICADGRIPKSVLEIAKKRGMKVGLVTSSTVYDASPAAFSAHIHSRKLGDEIVEAYLDQEPDILLGGGRNRFLPKNQRESRRKDYKDMIALFKNKGYAYVSTKKELMEVKGPRVLGLFTLADMSFEIDRKDVREPSVSDMTQAALRILQEGKENGFVVFIENENIDSSAHMSDVAGLIHEVREFDRAVGMAYEFYKKHPHETLILVTSDHETGGLALTGAERKIRFIGRVGNVLPSRESLKRIREIRISIGRAVRLLGKRPSPEKVDSLMAEHFKGFVLPSELRDILLKRKSLGPTFYSKTTAAVLGAMVAHNTQAYWIGRGHTNQPVFAGALGVGAEKFRGYQDNTDFAKHLYALLGEKKSH
jgi:alkaline phosphatase